MPAEVPVLLTGRLRMRPHRIADFADCAAMWGDPVVTRFIGGRPFSGEEVWTRILRYAGHWHLLGFGYWALEDKATGQFLGEVGFAEYQREIDPPLDGAPEIGWVLAPHAHGKGYATEAVRAALAWGDRHFEGPRTACLIHPDNLPSIRLAEKCGYREWLRTSYKGQPTILFSRDLKSESAIRPTP